GVAPSPRSSDPGDARLGEERGLPEPERVDMLDGCEYGAGQPPSAGERVIDRATRYSTSISGTTCSWNTASEPRAGTGSLTPREPAGRARASRRSGKPEAEEPAGEYDFP